MVMNDIVFPKGNEKDFLGMAEKLGIGTLTLVYPYSQFLSKKIPNIRSSKIKINLGCLVIRKELPAAKKLKIPLFVKAPEGLRGIFEYARDVTIFGIEDLGGKDFMHHRNSGVNHVLVKIAKKNNITFGYSFANVLSAKNHSTYMGKISQNVALAQKYGVSLCVGSFARDPYGMRGEKELKSFYELLGMDLKELKKAFL